MLGRSCSVSTSKYAIFFQDALFFLKDFFSNLASSVNPYLPVDPAAEGEPLEILSHIELRWNPIHLCLSNILHWFPYSVKADPSQKLSEEADAAAALGSDLTASMETTYSEQSSSSASSASSSEQPVYFRYEAGIK